MSILHDFEYYKPTNLKEVLNLRAEFGERSRILAGGTDLVVQMKENVIEPDIVIDVKGIEEFHEISFDDNTISTGNWITLDIPLSEFTDLTTNEHVAQLLLSGDITTVYVDNILFHK